MLRKFSMALATAAFLLTPFSHAQEATTVPEGYITVTIAPGTGVTQVRSVISLPLIQTSLEQGIVAGRISSITANTITVDDANWVAGGLSQVSSPHAIKITSGNAVGLTLLISTSVANTSDTLTIDAGDAAYVDLTTLEIVTGENGDTFELIECDTIGQIFGTPATTGVVGNTSVASADVLSIINSFGGRQNFYYNTSLGRWARQAIGNPDATNAPIRPNAGVQYLRLGDTPIVLTLLGRVPHTEGTALVKNAGLTYLANPWPVDITLNDSNIQYTPGWLESSSAATADIVTVGAQNFFWDGSVWRRQAIGSPISNPTIPAGTAVIINKKGAASGAALLALDMPYSLDN